MTSDPNYKRFCELSWRGKLTPREAAELEAWLAAHPETQTDWAAERLLSGALEKLPDAPVPSNFTARVLQAVELEKAAQSRRSSSIRRVLDWRLRWAPKVALAALLLVSGVVSHRHFQIQPLKMAESVLAVSEVTSLPNPNVLEDFEAIRALDQPPADVELLALLK